MKTILSHPYPRRQFSLKFGGSSLRIENPDTVFEVVPKRIAFDKYVTGKVYEGSFEVRNVSTIAHQVRVLPPKTQYFSLSLGKEELSEGNRHFKFVDSFCYRLIKVNFPTANPS